MMPPPPAAEPTAAAPRPGLKEPFCAISHGLGALLSLVALGALVPLAIRSRVWRASSLVVFGVSLVILYSASALYHGLRVRERFEGILQRLDHSAIFILIAGTYAPFCVGPLWGPWGVGLLGVEYALGLAGILLAWRQRSGDVRADAVRVGLYLAMGWAVTVVARPLWPALAGPVGGWLVAGGLAYTVGAIVFAADRPHLWPGRFSAHDLWHIFVLAGSACHFVAIRYFIAPAFATHG
jgi:hemolysin III